MGVERAMGEGAVRHPGQVVPEQEDAEIARQRWGPGRIRVLVRDGADFPHRVLDPHYTIKISQRVILSVSEGSLRMKQSCFRCALPRGICFSPESKRFTLETLLRYTQGASVAGSLSMTDSRMIRTDPPPPKFLSCSKVFVV